MADFSVCDVCTNIVSRGATGGGHWRNTSGQVLQMCSSCVGQVDDFILAMEEEYEDVDTIVIQRYETFEDEDKCGEDSE